MCTDGVFAWLLCLPNAFGIRLGDCSTRTSDESFIAAEDWLLLGKVGAQCNVVWCGAV